jgi:hypothetical protein
MDLHVFMELTVSSDVAASASFPWAATTGERIIGSVAQWRHHFMWLSGSCGMRSSDEANAVRDLWLLCGWAHCIRVKR